jgi:hypothetical protein
MKQILKTIFYVFVCIPDSYSQWARPNYNPYNPIIAGVPVSCTSFNGHPVAFIPNFYLQDVGRAVPGYPPIIELNPNVLANLTPKMQLFWYAHECAHHVLGPLNTEINADCWAIKTLRNQGFIVSSDIAQLQQQIVNTPGSIWGHLPGRQRAMLFLDCFLDN